MTLAQRLPRLGERGVANALRSVSFGGDHQRPHQRHLSTQRHLDVAPTGQLQHGARVPLGLLSRNVPRHARDCDDLGVWAGAGVEQCERVVDPGVDVDDDLGHGSVSMVHDRMVSVSFEDVWEYRLPSMGGVLAALPTPSSATAGDSQVRVPHDGSLDELADKSWVRSVIIETSATASVSLPQIVEMIVLGHDSVTRALLDHLPNLELLA